MITIMNISADRNKSGEESVDEKVVTREVEMKGLGGVVK